MLRVIKTRKRLFAVVAFLGLLFHAVVPFFAVYDVAALQSAAQETSSESLAAFLSGPDDKILICTEDGFKWVTLADLSSGKETPTPHAAFECALCYLAASGLKHAVVLAGNLFDFSSHKGVSFYRTRTLFSFSLYAYTPYRPRGPPLSFLS